MKLVLVCLTTLVATCVSVQQTNAGNPSATPNPFAGTYDGYFVGSNYGSMLISDTGSVSGYFSYTFPTFSESYALSGQVTAAGKMRLKVVHSVTVRDRRRGTSTERYSITVYVMLDESGNLVATSGGSFVLSPRP
jgi:hypothetical protein